MENKNNYRKNKNKILFYTIGSIVMPSSRVRIYIFENHLKENNIKYKIIPAISNYNCRKRINKSINSWFAKLVFLADIFYHLVKFIVFSFFYKQILIQKILFPRQLLVMLKFILKNKELYFDIDDVVFLPHQNDKQSNKHNSIKIKFYCNIKIYNKIITSSKYLNNLLLDNFDIDSSKIETINDSIDTNIYKSKKSNLSKIPTIGWIGTPSNTVYIEKCLDDLILLLNEGYKFELILVGVDEQLINQKYKERINYKIRRWSLEEEPLLYDSVDIGLMPLPDDVWSLGKGGYKLMLYMALGKISIASAIGINNDLVKNNFDGFLIQPGQSWYKTIKNVLDSYKNLDKIGLKARKKIEDNYSLKVIGEKFINVIK